MDVRDRLQMALDACREIAFHDLHVIDVVLYKQVAGADRFDDFQRLSRAAQEEVGDVTRVDGFDEQLDSGGLESSGGEPQVGDEGRSRDRRPAGEKGKPNARCWKPAGRRRAEM